MIRQASSSTLRRTSLTGTPVPSAHLRACSNSGFTEETRPPMVPTFTSISRVSPPRVTMTRMTRRSRIRRWTEGMTRIPRVPSSSARIAARGPVRAGSEITRTRWPLRPFFITEGMAEASLAPAAMSREMVYAMTSGVTSSTFVSRISTRSDWSPSASMRKTRRRFGT